MPQKINFAPFVVQDTIVYFNFKTAFVLISVILLSCFGLYSLRLYEVEKKKYEVKSLVRKKEELAQKINILSGQFKLKEKQNQLRAKKGGLAVDDPKNNAGLVGDYIQKQLAPRIFSRIFEILSDHSNPDIWLTHFNLVQDGYHFILEGKAEASEILNDFVKSLNTESLPGMDEMKIIQMEVSPTGLVSFKVSS
jgi:hypothetical protein